MTGGVRQSIIRDVHAARMEPLVKLFNGKTCKLLQEGQLSGLEKELLALSPEKKPGKYLTCQFTKYELGGVEVRGIDLSEAGLPFVVQFPQKERFDFIHNMKADLIDWIDAQEERKGTPDDYLLQECVWIEGKFRLGLQRGESYLEFEVDPMTHRSRNTAYLSASRTGAYLKKPLLLEKEFLFPPLERDFFDALTIPEGFILIKQKLHSLPYAEMGLPAPEFTAAPLPDILGFVFTYDKEGEIMRLFVDASGKFIKQLEES